MLPLDIRGWMLGFLFCCGLCSVAAQERTSIFTVQGVTLDSAQKQPLPGVEVRWLDERGHLVASGVTDSAGRFRLTSPTRTGRSNLDISGQGYQGQRVGFLAGNGNTDVGRLLLSPRYHDLAQVTVTTERPAVVLAPDKKIYTVAADLAARGGTVAEVFRQVPGVTITPSGKLSLRGGTPTVLVDGKRTNLTLDQIPADQVETIEIITNPSAKYDAQGSNGIINIMLKKNRRPGLHGSVGANWSTIPEYNAYVDLNASKGLFRFNLNYLQHGHRSEDKETALYQDLTDGGKVEQETHSVTQGPFRKAKFALDYLGIARSTLTLSGDWGGADFHTSTNATLQYLAPAGAVDSSAQRATAIHDNYRFWHAAANFNHGFLKQGEKWVSELSLEEYNGPESGTYRMQYRDEQGDNSGLPIFQQYSGGIRAHTLIFGSDYTDPLRNGKALMEAGVKLSWHKDHNQNDMQDYDVATGVYEPDVLATYDFHYSDPTYAAYGNYSDKYGGFSYMAGLRFEQYDYTGVLTDSAGGASYRNPGLYPSVFLTQKLGHGQELHLNYSRRVNRPGFDQVSPRIDYANPQDVTRGNPALRPEFTNLAELTYNRQAGALTLAATIYLRNTVHPITQFTTTLAGDTLVTSYINAGYSNTYGGEVIVKAAPAPWENLTADGNLFDTRISTTDVQGGVNNSGIGWFAKLTSDTRLPGGITAQLSGSYEAPKVIPQGKTLSTGSLDLAVTRNFLKRKQATVTLSLTDLFNTSREGSNTSQPGIFLENDLQKYKTRMLRVNLNYRFGRDK